MNAPDPIRPTILHGPIATPVENIGFRVYSKTYHEIRDLFAELNAPEASLLKALHLGHGIAISPGENPTLYFIVSNQQLESCRRVGVPNPTWLQVIGTSEVFALTQEDAEERFRKLKGGITPA